MTRRYRSQRGSQREIGGTTTHHPHRLTGIVATTLVVLAFAASSRARLALDSPATPAHTRPGAEAIDPVAAARVGIGAIRAGAATVVLPIAAVARPPFPAPAPRHDARQRDVTVSK